MAMQINVDAARFENCSSPSCDWELNSTPRPHNLFTAVRIVLDVGRCAAIVLFESLERAGIFGILSRWWTSTL